MTAKRREAKRMMHDEVADLISWSINAADMDTTAELVERYGTDLINELAQEMIDFHARLGQREYFRRALERFSGPIPPTEGERSG